MKPGPGMYAAGQKRLQKARIDAARARNVAGRLQKARIDAARTRNAAGQKRLQKARIDAALARNVCSRPEMIAEGQDRCSPGQECMQLARKGCRRPG